VRFGLVTLFPDLIHDAISHGVLSRGIERERIEVSCEDPRRHATDVHRTVDGRPFGGGPGMVMAPAPLSASIRALQDRLPAAAVVGLSPQGRVFDQGLAREWSEHGSLILVSGRYEGIDERVVEAAFDDEVSLGDFVLSGGEFAALAIIDAVARLVPGVLGDARSAMEDSFGDDGLLDCPHWTRPETFAGCTVPAVLLSGDHARIARWRREQALARTWARRPELLERATLDEADKAFLMTLGKASTEPG